jgi:hypothetical protein
MAPTLSGTSLVLLPSGQQVGHLPGGELQERGLLGCHLRGGERIHPAVHPGAGDGGSAAVQDHRCRNKAARCEGVGVVILIPLIRWVVKKLRARREENLKARQQAQAR